MCFHYSSADYRVRIRMPKPKGTHYVISAAFPLDGAPAYLTSDGNWSRELSEALPLETPDARDENLRRAEAQEGDVCVPYSFMVRLEDGQVDPLSARETIRSNGPTTRVRRPD